MKHGLILRVPYKVLGFVLSGREHLVRPNGTDYPIGMKVVDIQKTPFDYYMETDDDTIDIKVVHDDLPGVPSGAAWFVEVPMLRPNQ